jgi:hypothetical protein
MHFNGIFFQQNKHLSTIEQTLRKKHLNYFATKNLPLSFNVSQDFFNLALGFHEDNGLVVTLSTYFLKQFAQPGNSVLI